MLAAMVLMLVAKINVFRNFRDKSQELFPWQKTTLNILFSVFRKLRELIKNYKINIFIISMLVNLQD